MLEHANVIWNPRYQNHRNKSEKMQRRMLKYFKIDGGYPERGIDHDIFCRRLDIATLELRRNTTLVVFLFKLLNNLIDSHTLLEQV